jgi:FAD/FMN-containing dehydrogenase
MPQPPDLTFRPDRTPLVPPGGVDLHARDMSATFAADVTLRDAQTHLAALHQWLPIDGQPDQPLGRLVETNSTGPLRLGYGAWRDLLLGCQFTNGRGELVTAGGRTVKNVAGYDLTKFMVGQGGVFGRLVTITTRTYRRPDAGLVAKFHPDPRVINRLMPTPCRPQWACLTSQTLFCGYLGDARTLAYYGDALLEHHPDEVLRQTLDEDVNRRARLWAPAVADDSFRATVPPIKVVEFATAAGLTDWSADAAFGIVVGLAHPRRRDAIRAAARSAGGSVYFLDNGRVRADLDANRRALLDRLKRALDPDDALSPLPEP